MGRYVEYLAWRIYSRYDVGFDGKHMDWCTQRFTASCH